MQLIKTITLLVTLIFQYTLINAQNQKLDSIKILVEEYKAEDSVRVGLLIDLTKYYTTRDFNKSLPLIEEAIEISDKIGYVKGKGLSLNALSTLYTLNGELDKALTNALYAKDVLESIKDDRNLIVTYGTLARIYGANGKYNKALEIQKKNIELIQNDSSSSDKARYYFYAGKSCQELGKLHEAEEYFFIALQISQEVGFLTGVAIAQSSLGILANQRGDYLEAISYLAKTLEFFEKHNQLSNIGAAYNSLARSYEGLNDLEKAIECNFKAISIYNALNNYIVLKGAYDLHYKLYEKTKRLDSANKYLKLYYVMVDTIFSETKTQTIEELQTKYETEKKEIEIASLSQQAAIQTLELQQKNQAMIIGLVIVILLLTVVYFIYRQRSFKNQQSQTELEQRFLRSQLNPHFISNALLAVQNFMLKNQTEKAALYLAKFSKLMREILENSRQEFILVEDEVQMLTNFMDIHKLRMNDAFDYKINIDDSIDPEVDTIPPMFIQPFVENAIEHGVINAQDDGLIELNFVKNGEYISIEIRDNGEGLSQTNQKLSGHKSLSTTIIKERMDLFNKSLKNKIQLLLGDYKNDLGEIQGTKVELKVPFGYL